MSVQVTLTETGAVIAVNRPWPLDGDHHFFLQDVRTGRFLGENGWRPVRVTLPASLLAAPSGLELKLGSALAAHIAPDTSLLLADVFRGLRATFHWPSAPAEKAPPPGETRPAPQPQSVEIAPPPASAMAEPKTTASMGQTGEPSGPAPSQPKPARATVPLEPRPAPDPTQAAERASLPLASRRAVWGALLLGLVLGAATTLFAKQVLAPALSTDVQELQNELVTGAEARNDLRELLRERESRIADLESKTRDTPGTAEGNAASEVQTLRSLVARLENKITAWQDSSNAAVGRLNAAESKLRASEAEVRRLQARLANGEGAPAASIEESADPDAIDQPLLDLIPQSRPRGLWGALVHGGTGTLHFSSHEASRDLALGAALRKCNTLGVTQTCTLMTTFENTCLAVAQDAAAPRGVFGYAMQRTTPESAEAAALAQCGRDWSNCAVRVSICSQ